MDSFRYCRISSGLIDELRETVLSGESIAILGPRFGGKKYLMGRLHDLLVEPGGSPPVWVDLPRQFPVSTEQELHGIISNAATEANDGQAVTARLEDGLFSPIDKLAVNYGKPVIVLIPYIDGISHSLERRLLQEVRTRVQSRDMVAVLSGESDLRYLVHGPNSEFNCAHQFVLQGYDQDEFFSQFRRYAFSLNLSFEDESLAAQSLWQQTGGNAHILRLLFGSLIEGRVRNPNGVLPPVRTCDIPKELDKIEPPGARRAEVFHHSTRLINNESECWGDLRRLIDGETVMVRGLDEDAPGHLELAGVAIRTGRTLRMVSPLMADFLRYYYNDRQFGDLYARIGEWEEAFKFYARLKHEQRLRPLSTDDRANVIFTLKTLSAALYSAAPQGVEEVKKLFAMGCRYVLGFSEVTFWQHNKAWINQPLDGFPASQEVKDAVRKVLPQGNVSPGYWPLPNYLNSYGVAAILPALRSDLQGAVIVCNFENKIVISREREYLAKDLLEHFIKAYTHAISVEKSRLRLDVRNQHIEVINSIIEGLGRDVLNPGQVLMLAARGLRKLGYRRVLFSLVDPERQSIKGVLDDSDDPTVDVARMTDFPLNEPLADLQPYIVYTRESRIIENAAEEPLACKETVKSARMEAMAIVPIINLAGEAIGTIHVERSDRAVSAKDEVDDLMAFGRQLAVVIEQSDRVSLLQSALDKIPEPLVIVESREKIRYINKQGADLLNVTPGWRGGIEELLSSKKEFNDEALKMIRDSIEKGHREVHHFQQLLNRPEYDGEVLTDSLQDWRGKTIGGLLHIRDLSYLYKTLRALRLVVEAPDAKSATEAVLSAAQLMGFKWGRLYLIDENDPELFISKLAYGFKDIDLQMRFEQGLVKLPRRSTAGAESWLSIEKNQPLVFYFTKSLPDHSDFVTGYGLNALVINDPHCHEELEKEPEEFWLDIPLGTFDKPLGKLTLDCDKELRPENFASMMMLLKVVSDVLAAHLKRERETSEKMHLIKVATAEKIMASLTHNIATRLASLPVLLARYRDREKNLPNLRLLNDSFHHILDDVMTTVSRAKERLTTVAVKTTSVDLATRIERTLRSALSEKSWSVDCRQRPLEVNVDIHLLEVALLELLQNSRDLADDSDRLQISIKLEREQVGGNDWVRITYHDNGPGVPEELKIKIFEDFFSHRPGRKSGTGLGLSFVRRVVEAHEGSILESGKYGQGAEFMIVMPAHPSISRPKENGYVSHLDR